MMIKKILAAGALVASAAFLAPQASAQTFSPNGSFALANSGTFTVAKGLTLTCTVSGGGSVSSGAATVSSIVFSGGLCGSVLISGGPFVVTATTLTSFTIKNVRVTAITGSCFGDLVASSYDQSTGIITFTNVTIPATNGGTPCRVNGKIKLTPTITFTIP